MDIGFLNSLPGWPIFVASLLKSQYNYHQLSIVFIGVQCYSDIFSLGGIFEIIALLFDITYTVMLRKTTNSYMPCIRDMNDE